MGKEVMSTALVIFLLGSAGLLYLSKASIFSPKLHGFSRLIAWECIFLAFLLSINGWFTDPFSPLQLLSWVMLSISLILVVGGLVDLRRGGRDAERRTGEGPGLEWEKTARLVQSGVYRYIRHPLYGSLLYLALGICLKNISWPVFVLTGVAIICLVITALVEETENINYFGEEYIAYSRQTKRFVPFIF